jgi:hypothetical protein
MKDDSGVTAGTRASQTPSLIRSLQTDPDYESLDRWIAICDGAVTGSAPTLQALIPKYETIAFDILIRRNPIK